MRGTSQASSGSPRASCPAVHPTRVAVVVAGEICSGKSTVINSLARAHGWDVVSFGAYVRCSAERHGIEATRSNLQAVGAELLGSLGPDRFLADVMAYADPSSDVHIYDGVRHLAMLEALRRVYAQPVVIYLDVDARERYRKFVKRGRGDDSTLSYEGFLAMCDQPVERTISDLRGAADLCFDGSSSVEQIVRAAEDLLRRLGGTV